MEIRQYLLLFKKWVWLLALGVVLGGAGAYLFSSYQPVVYQARTKIMVSRATDQSSQVYSSYYDVQLASTYAQIINTDPVINLLSDELGYKVSKGQVAVKQVANAQLIEVTVSDSDPQKTAEIANRLVGVFIDYNKNLQNDRYQSIEDNLKAQIEQIEGQIATLQGEMNKASASNLDEQKSQLVVQANEIARLLAEADQEVIQIESQLETFIPTPAVTNTPAPSWIIPTATPVPVATPTLSAAASVQYRELQIRRDQLNEMRDLFQQAYGNLLVMQQNSGENTAELKGQIQNTLALYQQIYSGLLSNYEEVRLARLQSTPSVVQIEPAMAPSSPIQPQPMRNGMLGAASGLMVMGAIAFLIEYLDDTIKTPEDVHQHLQLPVLGMIGQMDGQVSSQKDKKGGPEPGIYVVQNPLSPITEGFRTLRTNLDFANAAKPIKVLMVTSPGPSEGKSTVAANLAAIIAQSGKNVILLDADLRRPFIHRIVGIANRQGLSDILREPNLLPDVVNPIEGTTLMVITTGAMPPNPSELLASERMTQIIERLKELSDIVVIDTPPTILSDAVVLSAKVDGVVAVLKPGGTRIGSAQVMMEQLKRSGARVLGTVLNPISRSGSNYYTKYHYYTQYYYKKSYDHYMNGGNGHNGSKAALPGLNGKNGKVHDPAQTPASGEENAPNRKEL